MLLTRILIENFRGIKCLDLSLDSQTVLIGENNSGKTSVLHALKYALDTIRNRKSSLFDDFDYHLDSGNSDPSTAPEIKILLEFLETKDSDWSVDIVRALNDVVALDENDRRVIRLQIIGRFDQVSKLHSQDFAFLDHQNNPLPSNKSSPAQLAALQRIRPYFLLSALRDAAKEFSRYSPYWGSFLKSGSIPADKKNEIEREIETINQQIVDLHTPFATVRGHLDELQKLIPSNSNHKVTIEALPGRVFDMLSRAQVAVSTLSGAQVPITRHGEGVQSLSVLMLFGAFLRARLGQAMDRIAIPLVALEEPEAHLHPSAVRNLWSTISDLDGQKIITTHSGDLLAEVPAFHIRRLYRKDGGIAVGYLKATTLDEKETRFFNQHIRLTRGELLFANCWLICEGETESLLIREISRIAGYELERWGVRVVEYRKADIAMFLKAAEDFGIAWHCLLDNDTQGRPDREKVKKTLNGRDEAGFSTIVQDTNMDQYLANCGFFDIYLTFLSDQLKAKITEPPGTDAHRRQVVDVVTKGRNRCKVEAAIQICDRLDADPKAVKPPLLIKAVEAALSSCGWKKI